MDVLCPPGLVNLLLFASDFTKENSLSSAPASRLCARLRTNPRAFGETAGAEPPSVILRLTSSETKPKRRAGVPHVCGRNDARIFDAACRENRLPREVNSKAEQEFRVTLARNGLEFRHG